MSATVPSPGQALVATKLYVPEPKQGLVARADLVARLAASGGGSNIRPLAGYVARTGWVRWSVGPSD